MKTCNMQSAVDEHFVGAIAPDVETRMREHLPTCDRCRARYTKRLLLAKLDPSAVAARERIAHGLGIGRRANRAPFVIGLSFALAAAAVIFVWLRFMPASDAGFASRGEITVEPASHVQIYRVAPRGMLGVAQGSAGRDDELAFAYENGAHKEGLMIFGVDEHGHVYWYHPAWTRESDDPAAVRIERDGARHELREAIAHHLDGHMLEIHALFVDRALTVKQVEGRLAGRAAPLGALAIEGTIDHVVPLAITP